MPGGYFIATLCDGNAIVRTIRNCGHREGSEMVWKVAFSSPAEVEFHLLHRYG